MHGLVAVVFVHYVTTWCWYMGTIQIRFSVLQDPCRPWMNGSKKKALQFSHSFLLF
jgi:hypothetical protein